MTYPYFKYTKPHLVKKDFPPAERRQLGLKLEREICDKWLTHFKQKGIAACVTRETNEDGRTCFHVWREGKEHRQKQPPNAEEFCGEIIADCCGFREKYGA